MYSIVMTTCGRASDCRKLEDTALKKRLAVCVKSFPIKSSYVWKHKVVKDREVLMIFETSLGKVRKLCKELESLHPYDTPVILSFRTNSFSRKADKWLKEVLG